MLYMKEIWEATGTRRMSTSLLWGVDEDIMEDTLRSHIKQRTGYKRIMCGKDSIRISDFSVEDLVVSHFLLKVAENAMVFSCYCWQRGIINLTIFQTPIMYTSQVLHTTSTSCSSAQKRLHRTIMCLQVASSNTYISSTPRMHPRGHLILTGRRHLGSLHFPYYSCSLRFHTSYMLPVPLSILCVCNGT